MKTSDGADRRVLLKADKCAEHTGLTMTILNNKHEEKAHVRASAHTNVKIYHYTHVCIILLNFITLSFFNENAKFMNFFTINGIV